MTTKFQTLPRTLFCLFSILVRIYSLRTFSCFLFLSCFYTNPKWLFFSLFIDVPDVIDDIQLVEKCQPVIGSPVCQKVELVLPKQVCQDILVGYAHKPSIYEHWKLVNFSYYYKILCHKLLLIFKVVLQNIYLCILCYQAIKNNG